MRAAAAVLGLLTTVVCAGCGFQSTQAPGDGRTPDDARVDASDASQDAPPDASPPDARPDGPPPDSCVTFSRQLNTCGLALTTDLTIAQAASYNTDTRELRIGGDLTPIAHVVVAVNGENVDAILVRDLTIRSGVTLRAVGVLSSGAPPLAIIAGGTVTLEDSAAIDVSDGGAGAIAACSTPPALGDNSVFGAGGGGGGAYGAAGGDGGSGNMGGTPAAGGHGGKSVAMSTGLQGGCPGARGGVGTGLQFGVAGRGGGAMLLVAAGTINLGMNAVLQAGGGGGGGGTHGSNPDTGDGGGGGGGSGGLIRLEAPRVLGMTARIVANGGGGGEGSSVTEAGANGAPGTTTTAVAPGGSGGADDGADGAQGGAGNTPAGANVVVARPGGGGGGGGSVGYIHILSPDARLGANVSPTAVVVP